MSSPRPPRGPRHEPRPTPIIERRETRRPPVADRRSDEIKVHGRYAARALFERRPDDVKRVFVREDLMGVFGDMLRACARRHVPYKLVGDDDLARLTESTHHEGICLVARPKPMRSLDEVLATPGPSVLVLCADVANPHNVGAILRAAAHFGARAALLAGMGRVPPAALRTSQGGAEWLDLVAAPDARAAVLQCRGAGFEVYATSSHGGDDLFSAKLRERALVLLGSEGEGLDPSLADTADRLLRIPGTGHVESLNVSAAAAVVLAELWRRRSV